MYTHCLFCAGSLGANEALEHFPVGTRLAFDAKRGRLWVICPKCERWCLTPLEERWEAIEEAQRQFEKSPRRASSTHIGLARTNDGTTLVRIGEPTKLEFAAWRYGDQFGRRRRRNLLLMGGATAAAGAVLLGGPMLGLYAAGSVSAGSALLNGGNLWMQYARTIARLKVPGADGAAERTVRVTTHLLKRASLFVDREGEWGIRMMHRLNEFSWNPRTGLNHVDSAVDLTGIHARRAAALLLPHVNRFSGSRDSVDDAVRLLDGARDSDALFATAARNRHWEGFRWFQGQLLPGTIAALPAALRLALEMSAHEHRERLALDGELAELERAWRDAEEIAAIADDLLPNPGVTGRLSRLLKR